jgi:hypothetical protein
VNRCHGHTDVVDDTDISGLDYYYCIPWGGADMVATAVFRLAYHLEE